MSVEEVEQTEEKIAFQEITTDPSFYKEKLTQNTPTSVAEILYMRKNNLRVITREAHIMGKHGEDLQRAYEEDSFESIIKDLAESAQHADDSFKQGSEIVYLDKKKNVIVVARYKKRNDADQTPPPSYIVTGYVPEEPNNFYKMKERNSNRKYVQ